MFAHGPETEELRTQRIERQHIESHESVTADAGCAIEGLLPLGAFYAKQRDDALCAPRKRYRNDLRNVDSWRQRNICRADLLRWLKGLAVHGEIEMVVVRHVVVHAMCKCEGLHFYFLLLKDLPDAEGGSFPRL